MKEKIYKYLNYTKFMEFLIKGLWMPLDALIDERQQQEYLKSRNDNLVKDIQYMASKGHP